MAVREGRQQAPPTSLEPGWREGERMTKDETADGRAEENVHRLTTSEIVRMVGGMLEWACREKGCKYGLRFPSDQIEAISSSCGTC